ncbi:MAG: hypothetical protein AABY13_01955, partial [Nanoarchaeota archaeon]
MIDNVRVLLTNKTGGYALLGEKPQSRFEGVFFARNGQLYKTIESLQYATPAERITNRIWCVERQRGQVTERLVMPHGQDALLLDMSAPQEFTLALDVKQSYDNRVWGRDYDISAEKGCVVFSFTKRNDGRDDNRAFHDEFDCHLAVCATPLDYMPLKQWEEHFYPSDQARGSSPDSRWVHVGAKFRGSRFAFGFGLTKNEALATARTVLARSARILDEEEKRVAKRTTSNAFA